MADVGPMSDQHGEVWLDSAIFGPMLAEPFQIWTELDQHRPHVAEFGQSWAEWDRTSANLSRHRPNCGRCLPFLQIWEEVGQMCNRCSLKFDQSGQIRTGPTSASSASHLGWRTGALGHGEIVECRRRSAGPQQRRRRHANDSGSKNGDDRRRMIKVTRQQRVFDSGSFVVV